MYRIGWRTPYWTIWQGYCDTREEAVNIRARGKSVIFKKIKRKGK